jgi:hypothetical protein
MATRSISSVVSRPDGSPWKGAEFRFRQRDDTYVLAPDITYPIRTLVASTDASGVLSVTLASGVDVIWDVTGPDGETFSIFVPNGSATTLEALRFAYDGVSPIPPPDLQGFVEDALADPAVQATIDHVNLQHIGANSHAAIDTAVSASTTHIAATAAHGATGAVVGTTNTQTLTNKTLGSGTKVAVGSDATGDLHYRDSGGNLARIAIGTAGQALLVNGSANGFTYGAGGGGGGAIELKEGNVQVIAAMSALDFNAAYFDVANAGSGRGTVTASALLIGGNGSGTTNLVGAAVFQIGDLAGSVVTTGTKAYLRLPFDAVITKWTLLTDTSSTTTLDVGKDTYANYPPTFDADRIAGTDKPAVSAGTHAESTALTGWTTSVTAGDVLAVEIEANDNAKYIVLQLQYTRAIVNQYTNEDAQDAVGGILTDSTSIDFTYDDAGNSITAVAKYAGTGSAATLARSDHNHDTTYAALSHTHTAANVTDFTEAAQDAIGTALTDSASVDFTYDDTANTITAVVLPNTVNQKLNITKAAAGGGTRKQLNFIEGANTIITVADDSGNDRINVTIATTGGGGGGGSLVVQEGGVATVGTATALNFDASDFNTTDETAGVAGIALAYGTTAGTPAEGNHTHTSAGVTDFTEAVEDVLGAGDHSTTGFLRNSAGISWAYVDASDTLTASPVFAGSGGDNGTAGTPARSDHNHLLDNLSGALEFIQDAVNSTVVDGTALTKTYNDPLGTYTLDVDLGTTHATAAFGDHTHTAPTAPGGITNFDEAAQDAVGAMVANSTSINLTYVDATPSLTATANFAGTGSASTVARSDQTHTFTGAVKFVLGDPGGSAITTGTKGYISMPFACTITKWRLLLDQSSTTTLDVWKQTYASYPPTDTQRIAGTDKPSASAATKAESTALTGWTTSVSAGDVLGIEVEANNNAKFAELTIEYSRTI